MANLYGFGSIFARFDRLSQNVLPTNMGTINTSSFEASFIFQSTFSKHFYSRLDPFDLVKISSKLAASVRSLGMAIEHSDPFLVTTYRGNRKNVAEDDSDMEHEENLMTDQ